MISTVFMLPGRVVSYQVRAAEYRNLEGEPRKGNCFVRTPFNAQAHFTAQDGETPAQSVLISTQCPKVKSKKHSAHHKHH